MKTAIVAIYRFVELPKEVQDTIIEKNRYMEVEAFNWWDSEYEYLSILLGEKGVSCSDFAFDLHQREFELDKDATVVDPRKLLKAAGVDLRSKVARLILQEEIEIEIYKGSWHYPGTRIKLDLEYLDIDFDNGSKIDIQIQQIESQLKEWLKSFKQEAITILERQYNWLTSDECLRDWFMVNNSEFLANGKPWYEIPPIKTVEDIKIAL